MQNSPDNILPYVLSLHEAGEVGVVGGKAINLMALIRAGFPVPEGFVVTTDAFRSHGGDGAGVERAVAEAYAGLGDSVAVAVRSSATAEDMAGASMAGQYETYLDIVGAGAVMEAVRKCWRSLSTPRTQAYLQQHQIDPASVAMAVVVQRLIPSDVAGVMFTVNPRTANESEILIEASYGLGETVVSGLVQPDTVLLDKATGKTKSYLVGSKEIRIVAGNHEHAAVAAEMQAGRSLTEFDLKHLHGMALRAEEHFGGPQDTEWAISEGKLYLLQSRAVTTLESAKAKAAAIEQTRSMLREWKSQGRGDWARHNLGETLPQPTPLTWSVLQRFMTPAGGFGRMYAMAGYEPSLALNPQGFLDLIAGRIYMDLRRAPEMFFAHFPFQYDVELLRASAGAAQAAPTVPAGSLLAQFRIGKRLKKAGERLAGIAEGFDSALDGQMIPAFRKWIIEESRCDVAALTAEDWLATWKHREGKVMDEFAPQSLLPSLICGMALENLKTFLAPFCWEEDPEELANLFAAGGPPDATLRSNQALYQVAKGELSVDEWLAENGHRAPEEFDLATLRWRERPAAVAALAQHLVNGANPAEEHESRARESAARLDALRGKLTAPERQALEKHVALCHRYLRFREDGKHELMRGYELLRLMVIDAGRRLGIAPADVCLLTLPQLSEVLQNGDAASLSQMKLRIEAVRQRRTAESRLPLPDIIGAADIETLGELKLPAHADRLEAFSISTGVATGPVRIVASPESAGDLGSGYILVCRSTDPSWTPLFVNAAGIVLECGGSLSHGAVVAREMGKPAVVLANATQLLAENQSIAIDAVAGAVLLTGAATGATTPVKEAASATDTHVPWSKIPPAAGRREEAGARLRNVWGLFWLAFLALMFLMPGTHLRDASMRVLDVMLWPIYRGMGAWGGIATVGVIAATIAALSMVLQWALTDTPRLREAKRRAGALKKEAAKLPADSPRRKKLVSLAAPVQTRITLAAFVPLALLLGPMVLSFLWLPERLDPASANPRPGANAIITAQVDPDYAGPVTLNSALVEGPLEQTATPIRPTLEGLEKQLEKNEIPPTAAARFAQTSKSGAELLSDLRRFLAKPLPAQTVTWTVPTPSDKAAIYEVSVKAQASQVSAPLVLGNIAPPPLSIGTDEKGNCVETVVSAGGPLRALKIRYADLRRGTPVAFFAPFARIGWGYDFGWLGAYLLFYIVALFTAKRVLRVP